MLIDANGAVATLAVFRGAATFVVGTSEDVMFVPGTLLPPPPPQALKLIAQSEINTSCKWRLSMLDILPAIRA
jgi:hypothetical protein